MRRALQIAVLFAACAGLLRAEIVDRIVATVNGQPILQSDWDIAMRCEAFLDQRALQFRPEAARASLDRLVDQELLRQQVRDLQLPPVGEDKLRSRLEEIRHQIPGAAGDAGWQAALGRYGLTQSEIEERIADQMEILRFIDVRLRPTVHVDRRSIEAYYNDTLLLQLKEKGAQQVPLAEVSAKIEEILSQQILDSLLADLLRDLRQQGEIHIDGSALPPPAANGTGQSSRQAQPPRLPRTPVEAR
jgi:SurA N-terminal domain